MYIYTVYYYVLLGSVMQYYEVLCSSLSDLLQAGMTDTSTEVKEQKDIIQAEKNKRSKYKVCVRLQN